MGETIAGKGFGEYAARGRYHVALDPKWPYLPVYLAKRKRIEKYLRSLRPGTCVLDVGCGEGAMVEIGRAAGLAMEGVDANYESDRVRRADARALPQDGARFDVVLCLDLLEHLPFDAQPQVLREITRVLKPDGTLLLSLPNLSHLLSRLTFLATGRLIRTSGIERHPGDRPIAEFLDLIRPDFVVEKREGLFPTFPLISVLTRLVPSRVIRLHEIYNALFPIPGICFQNLIWARRRV